MFSCPQVRAQSKHPACAAPSHCLLSCTQALPMLQERQTLTSMAVSEDVELVATGAAHAAIHLTDLTAAPRATALPADGGAADPVPLTAESATTTLYGHDGPVYGLSFSPDRRILYSAGCDGTVRMWATELGANLVIWEGHGVPVWAVAASPLGHWLASGSVDCTCRLWCVAATPYDLILGDSLLWVRA